MINIRNITKTFNTPFGKVDVLKDVSLNIEKGDIFGIIGFSGAGKSTLIRCLNCLESPDDGEVYIENMYMVAIVSVATIVLGTLLGIVLVTTQKNNILSSPKINKVIGTIVNILRSFPTIILIIIALPLSRLIVGTTIGKEAAVIPITIGMIPFLSRVVESSLKEVDYGKIEAAIAMGANPIQIIFKVLIPEGLPSLIRGYTLSIISIIGCTALAGSIGAGGLGSVAIRYGYQRFQTDYMIVTIIILVILVQGIQLIGDVIAKKINNKRFKLN